MAVSKRTDLAAHGVRDDAVHTGQTACSQSEMGRALGAHLSAGGTEPA